jgi:nicotinamidase-related amidase
VRRRGGEEGLMKGGYQYRRLCAEDAAVLFVDHQSGLTALVQDYSPSELRNGVMALAAVARYFELPCVLTTSFEKGPNGPILPELRAMLPNAPLIARPGEINAWDNADFVRAVQATGRRQLIIAGIVTEVCVAFPALSAIEAGYEVFVVTDASGTFDAATRQAAWLRLLPAGAQLVNWFAVASELQRDWRKDPEGFGQLLSAHTPVYRSLMVSHEAQRIW